MDFFAPELASKMIEVVDNIMPQGFNRALLLELCAFDRWGVGGAYQKARDPEMDYGMMMNTYTYGGGPAEGSDHLNTYARIALTCGLERLPEIQNKYIGPVRVAYNRYAIGGYCAEHPDVDPSTTPELITEGTRPLSFLYHINDSDAKNVFRAEGGDVEFETKAGRAIIFDSRIYHFSTPPQSSVRYTLNVIFDNRV